MKTLYFECNMGAAGDMLMASLYEICEEKELFLSTMNRAFSPYGITVTPEAANKCGISGTHMRVFIHDTEEVPEHTEASADETPHEEHSHTSHHHTHSSYPELLEKIHALNLPDPVKEHASAIYELIGNAEAKVHSTTLKQIHFHEVGSLDALADVCGCALLLHLIAPEQIIASPIHVGTGFVQCAHGVLPVPAPATAELLKGIPFYSGTITGELLTPTGAAILRHYVDRFATMPVMTVEQIGYGMGRKDFPIANCVRAFVGEYEVPAAPDSNHSPQVPVSCCDDRILSISCNLDDMTGEAIGFASEVLLQAGALDVYTTPIQMKKSRPGIILTCLCNPDEKEKFTELFFKHTTTRGVRYTLCERAKLTSSFETVATPDGDIRIKTSEGYGAVHKKPEFEDLKAIALEKGWALEDVLKLLEHKE